KYGAVAQAQVITDRETGRSRGFGFVVMDNDEEAQRAIDGLNNQPFRGRPLTVNEARPREDRGGGGGGGGGGGRGGGGGGGGRGRRVGWGRLGRARRLLIGRPRATRAGGDFGPRRFLFSLVRAPGRPAALTSSSAARPPRPGEKPAAGCRPAPCESPPS